MQIASKMANGLATSGDWPTKGLPTTRTDCSSLGGWGLEIGDGGGCTPHRQKKQRKAHRGGCQKKQAECTQKVACQKERKVRRHAERPSAFVGSGWVGWFG